MSTDANLMYEWKALPWKKIERATFKLQKRIYQASQRAEVKTLHRLQRLLLHSRWAKLLATRKVTQDNGGKHTAGVDGIKSLSAKERLSLVDSLHISLKAKPVRRILIPKPGKTEKRALGIPVIQDRCLQTMVVQALEPVWEAKFEAGSYGFRPGRSCQDAIERVFRYCRPNSRHKWVVDADIKGAFDYINHPFLLNCLGRFPAKELMAQWLKAGYLEKGVFHATQAGTPQGGSCSPLLANIALHGLEKAMGMSYQYGGGRTQTCGPRRVVRYADDFLVFCSSQQEARLTVELLHSWL